MEKDYFEEFINNKKEYNNTKRHNVNKKLDYIIAQTDVIFNILKDINDNQIKAELININQVKPPDFNNPPMMLLNADNTDIQGDNNITWKVKNELESYALDLNYVGCKIIINLCNIAGFTAITRYSVPLSEPPRIWAVRLHAAKPLFFAPSVELVEKSQTQLPVDTFPVGLSC